MYNNFLKWLHEQKETLDKIIANAGFKYYQKNSSKSNFGFDISECQFESFNLIKEKDLCYDRPNTPFGYSLWYHARRVNIFLTYFGKQFFELNQPAIEIFDLGAGTGAVQWGIGLIYHYSRINNIPIPKLKIINIDVAPLMLMYSKHYLWPEFLESYPFCKELVNEIEYEVCSWANNQNIRVNEPWIIASYLFDISDSLETPNEHSYNAAAKSGFSNIIRTYNPARVMLLSSNQEKKRQLLSQICLSCEAKGYNYKVLEKTALLFNGPLHHTSALRMNIASEIKDSLQTVEAKRLSSPTYWQDGSFTAAIISKIQQTISLESTSLLPAPKIDLYLSPIKVRREIVLNDAQLEAAKLSDRPTIITGPAGCGKSVVITERLKNLVEASNYDISLKLLVSTFNKELTSYLGGWIQNLLSKERCRRSGNFFYFNGSNEPNIRLMHFDILPTKLGNVYEESNRKSLIFNEGLRNFAAKAIEIIKTKNLITTNKFDKVLQPDYIIEEYHRIIYGLQYVTKDEFLNSERSGRPVLRKNAEMRNILWDACMEYLNILENSQYDSISSRRHKFLKKLKAGKVSTKFSHIFIDEFQDCTEADYLIFDLLLTNPNNLVLAGDLAQAVHIGKVADIPRIRTEEMRNRKTVLLYGSYRLPFRISEALCDLSKSILKGSKIMPYKSAPPGARPIILYGDNLDEITCKVKEVYNYYRFYKIGEITILENNSNLFKKLKEQSLKVETDTVLRLKGMEKTCVLWSTEIDIEYKDEVAEFVYTILSRTSGILIIVITPQTLQKYNSIFRLLREDRLIFWDQVSKYEFQSRCASNYSDESEVVLEE
jgi:hypothetical protein